MCEANLEWNEDRQELTETKLFQVNGMTLLRRRYKSCKEKYRNFLELK